MFTLHFRLPDCRFQSAIGNYHISPCRKFHQDPVRSYTGPGRILAGLHINRERLTGSYLGARLVGSYIREAKLVGACIGSYEKGKLVGSRIGSYKKGKLVGSRIGSYQKGKLVGSCTTVLQK